MNPTHPDDGPLPQWERIGGYDSGQYEAVAPDGTVWRLWLVEQPQGGDPMPSGYQLAPRGDGLASATYVTGERGLYFALDMAGMRIASQAVREDPEGARRQLGLD